MKRRQAEITADLFYAQIARRAQFADSEKCVQLKKRLKTVDEKLLLLQRALSEWQTGAMVIANDVSVDCECCNSTHDISTSDFETGVYLNNSQQRLEGAIKFIGQIRRKYSKVPQDESKPPSN